MGTRAAGLIARHNSKTFGTLRHFGSVRASGFGYTGATSPSIYNQPHLRSHVFLCSCRSASLFSCFQDSVDCQLPTLPYQREFVSQLQPAEGPSAKVLNGQPTRSRVFTTDIRNTQAARMFRVPKVIPRYTTNVSERVLQLIASILGFSRDSPALRIYVACTVVLYCAIK